MTQLPARAQVIIIGGGVIGTSIAYHLSHLGWTDVVVLERDKLTSGTTWHAAGLMTCFGSLSHTSTAIRLYGRDLYARLEAETGLSTGFRPVGLIEAAADEQRLHEYRRVATFQRSQGLEVHEISPAEIAERFPLAKVDDLLAGFFVPGDGRVNPVDLTMSLARGAKQRGVRFIEGVAVDAVLTQGQPARVRGVRTEIGAIECDVVVNAAGMWARELAARNGIVVPNQAAEHYYLLTEPIQGVHGDLPVFEDPAAYGYYREEGGGLMVGLFEPKAAPWRVEGIPRDFSFGTLAPDWERMEPFVRTAMERVPITLETGIRTLFCGPESFTPDLAPVLGQVSTVPGYFVCAGLNSIGILSSGGLGRVMAQWISTGHPDVDVTGWHVDRFQPQGHLLTPSFRRARTAEILGTVYAAHPPGTQLLSGRGIKRSPLHDKLIGQGAAMKDVSGWESPDWYAGPGATPAPTAGWGRAPWWEHWQAEHDAVRTGVGLLDMSFMAKFLLDGPDAAGVLDRLSAAGVAGDSGRITYTQWLNEIGGIEADLTVTRLAAEQFLVVASDTAHGHALGWLTRHTATAQCTITDVTARYAMLSLQGPRSRAVLAAATESDVSGAAFGFRDARWIDLDQVPALAVRITYVGELGWELYVPIEYAAHAYETILAAGAPHGLRHVGLKALGSLRLEKGYRDYGHDIDNTDDLAGVGLGFAVDRDKDTDWIGRTPTLAALAAGPPSSRLVQILVTDPDPLLVHAEIVLRDGIPVGDVRSGSYGWSVGGAVGLAMLTRPDGVVDGWPAWLSTGTWEVDIAGQRHPARVSLRPFYDPSSERVRV